MAKKNKNIKTSEDKKVDAILKKIYKKPTGKEKGVNEVIYFGVSDTPYAEVREMERAGVKYKKSKSGAWGYPDKRGLKKLLHHLLKMDGHLIVQ